MAGGGPGNTALIEVGQETDKEGGRGEVSLLAKAEGMDPPEGRDWGSEDVGILEPEGLARPAYS